MSLWLLEMGMLKAYSTSLVDCFDTVACYTIVLLQFGFLSHKVPGSMGSRNVLWYLQGVFTRQGGK
jgi:hypothetical protein